MPSLASSSTRHTYVHRHRCRQNTQIHKSKLNGVYMCLYPQIYAPLNSSHPVGRSYKDSYLVKILRIRRQSVPKAIWDICSRVPIAQEKRAERVQQSENREGCCETPSSGYDTDVSLELTAVTLSPYTIKGPASVPVAAELDSGIEEFYFLF